jgi:hypothetical protein
LDEAYYTVWNRVAARLANSPASRSAWVVYKVRLNPQWSRQPLKLAVHACLPEGVEARIEAWKRVTQLMRLSYSQ